MGVPHTDHFGGKVIYCCKQCRAFLTNREERVSANFVCQTGKAYLFNRATNFYHGEMEDKDMISGKHVVRDVFCKKCNVLLGWMYEMALVPEQRYKEGKVVLEAARIKAYPGLENGF